MKTRVITNEKQGIRILAGILLAMIEGRKFNEDNVKEILKELADCGYVTIKKDGENGDRDNGNDEKGNCEEIFGEPERERDTDISGAEPMHEV